MGKRYHCLYCDAFVAATPSAIRTHCSGLAHQRLRSEHYQCYKDAETILSEECTKKPCLKFANGECLFGGKCRFSHYTKDQIEILKNQVAAKSQCKNEVIQPSLQLLYERLQAEKISKTQHKDNRSTIYCDQGQTTVCPWTYPAHLDSCQDSLPPSLKKIKLEDLSNAKICEWG